MALNFNGVDLDVDANKLPTGYTKTPVAQIANPEYTRNTLLTVVKATVHNASTQTTVDNIVADVDTQVQAIIVADYDTVGLTVDASARIALLSSNISKDEALYTDDAQNYIVSVEMRVTTTV